MKKKIFILLFALTPLATLAQELDTSHVRDPRAREKIRAAHAAYITERLELTSTEAEQFWPIYRKYGEERRQLWQQMREVRRSGMNEEELLKRELALKQRELDLEKAYTEKFSRVIPASKLVKLRQAEADFRRLLLRQIQQRRHPRR